MKQFIITLVFFAINQSYFFTQELKSSIKSTAGQKGTFYFYWGWNRGAYSKSDIQFTGASYDFTLSDVKASDRQSAFDPKVYFGLTKFTIPQYNFRMGYYINEHYQVSLGADHMKYVMVTNQLSTIDGSIANSGTSYDGTYDQQSFVIKPNFLLFEHTDGLNYLNSEFRRSDVLINKKYFQVSVNEGLGIGLLVPRTNTTLLNNPRYDEFHVSGVGFGGVAALHLTFFKYLIVQSELKGGFISMPDIRTTMYVEDRASQHFWWTQFNVVFGLQFPIIKKSVKKAGVIFD
jgi:hypothetical protein